MKKVILNSYAKVNLFLKVGKKFKKSKLHNIQSLVFLISLNDKIVIQKIFGARDIIKFEGKFKKNINKKNNSIKKALMLLRKKNYIDKKIKFKIVVKKNIPVFSGLGGGSSNAATLIKYFIKNRKINNDKIEYFSKYLGSDFKLFFKSKKILQQNLFQLKDFKKKYSFYFLIVFPYLKASTKEIYSKLKKPDKIEYIKNYQNNSRIGLIKVLKLEKNSLQKIIISKFPTINHVLTEMNKLKKLQFSRVTGSGSACFALFLTKNDGTSGLRQIKKKFPKFWCVLCKTI